MLDNPKLNGKRGLFIAEKPSAMKEFQNVFRKFSSEFSFSLDFTSLAGFVTAFKDTAEMNPDWKQWRLDTLPMLPDESQGEWDYIPSSTGKDLYKKVKEQIETKNYDFIVSGPDADMAGSAIVEGFLGTIPKANKIPWYRFWNKDMSEKDIVKTFHNLYEYDEFIPRTGTPRNIASGEYLRQKMDWLIGLNSTRLLTVKSGTKLRSGRVNTPTMKILYDREMEIKNFVSKTYYTVKGEFDTGNGKYFGTLIDEENNPIQFPTKEEAKKAVTIKAKDIGTIFSLSKKKVKEKQPGLYSTAKLQGDMSRIFGVPLDKSMEAIDANYKAKISTYPRTESAVISTELFKDILPVFEMAKEQKEFKNIPMPTKAQLDAFEKNKSYVNDKALSSHTAIVPTEFNPNSKINFDILTTAQKQAFYLVARSIILGFEDVAIKEKTEIITEVGDYKFKTQGSVTIDEGWQRLVPELKSVSEELPVVNKGDKVTCLNTENKEGKTKPKPRYNATTLINIMENVYRLVEDEGARKLLKSGTEATTSGIGAPATRSSIVTNLIDNGYIKSKGKKNEYTVTDLGINLIKEIKDTELASPMTTAKFEALFDEVRKGSKSEQLAYDEIVTFTKDLISELNKVDFSSIQAQNSQVVGFLGENNPVKESKDAYYDTEFQKYLSELKKAEEDGSEKPQWRGFYLKKKLETPKMKMKGTWSRKDVSTLLDNKTVTKEVSFSGQPNKRVEFELKNGKVQFVQNKNGGSSVKKENISVGSHSLEKISGLNKDNKAYAFYVIDGNQDFKISETIAGTKLTEEQLLSLIETGKTSGTWNGKNGKFDADLVLDKSTYQLKFDFSNNSTPSLYENGDKKVVHIKGKNAKGNYSFYKINDKYSVSDNIAGHIITKDELISLAENGKVFISGFVSKQGKNFDAELILDGTGTKFNF